MSSCLLFRHGMLIVASIVNLVRPTIVTAVYHDELARVHLCLQQYGHVSRGFVCEFIVSVANFVYIKSITQSAHPLQG